MQDVVVPLAQPSRGALCTTPVRLLTWELCPSVDPVNSIAGSKLLGSEDETGSGGAGGIATFDSSWTGRWRSRGAVIVIRAGEDRTCGRREARDEAAALNADARERARGNRPVV